MRSHQVLCRCLAWSLVVCGAWAGNVRAAESDKAAATQNNQGNAQPDKSRADVGDTVKVLKGDKAKHDAATELAARQMARCELRLRENSAKKIDQIEDALLVFGDAARMNTNGTLWAYGRTGRPLAFVELFKGNQQTDSWCHAATLTGTHRVTLTAPRGVKWQPEKIQIEPARLESSTAPSEKEYGRLRQMRDLARRFTAHEYWDPDNSRFELRLLIHPVLRYKEPGIRVQDGAVFVFANGTNPEGLLLLEAVGNELQNSSWQYSVARLGSAEIHFLLDEKEVWKCERAAGIAGAPNDPYWLFFADDQAR